jgi:hypothetical protein
MRSASMNERWQMRGRRFVTGGFFRTTPSTLINPANRTQASYHHALICFLDETFSNH